MNSQPYLRAYMAGIVVPTLFLLVAIVSFTIARMVYNVPVSIERQLRRCSSIVLSSAL